MSLAAMNAASDSFGLVAAFTDRDSSSTKLGLACRITLAAACFETSGPIFSRSTWRMMLAAIVCEASGPIFSKVPSAASFDSAGSKFLRGDVYVVMSAFRS